MPFGNADLERPLKYYTVSLARPLARLALSTKRPPRVFIRARNPWSRFRFNTWG
ncbi:hypothetical protein CCP3SC1AL1_50014 [Gammaproteobacteria bacterium]